ncbi:MAG: calcium-binding protein [Candidatus Dactylopiibacterium carminicum]|uniref:Calcium-binding protein n=1 Tax=Candidatus Dactylopiibacterium carminicum TaxID=857335 RepID=A0A272EP50_9RHOO|nr:EF-hand domain-containing protein [Candidatus Dactylopiibacterium carminicum]KAF7598243.1 calcium-binding protein [Candidatus Dactylopiibacterium carminicum]PAS91897.1 MAG: calcium-binding protein [Candidatus Dactylopiibacterium carminicum]PAS94873.1 MAG: calcium-binding protein [Candidatus Dactylopiibacterium carminicum]PAS97086.1 MAG: hypothetical protein BSR46_14440 [Candidatus Dactylopiibacterium carminicum]
MISSISNNFSSLASSLVSRLDSQNKGYLEQADLQSALTGLSSDAEDEAASLFSALDSDSDGKLTESELTASLNRLAEQLESQLSSGRMQQALGNMPPPPPPPEDDEGFTLDELKAQLNEIGNSDSEQASLISNIVANFEAADTNGDGKVSFTEAQAYDQSLSSTTTTASAGSAATDEAELAAMLRVMQLARSYGSDTITVQQTSVLYTTA